MKNMKLLIIALFAGSLLAGCSKSADPSTTSVVSLKMSATTATGSPTINGRVATTVTVTDITVNVRDIKFDFDKEDEHFKHDSSFVEDHDAKLKGPFILNLMNAGSFANQVIASVSIPNAKYEKVSFKLVPSTASGDMNGKSILMTGTIAGIPFVFWHNRDTRFGAKQADSTAVVTTGAAVNLAIQLELDKILSAVNGGVDLSTAVDGNQDGTITIDPANDDGNKDLADAIMNLLVRHTHCKKEHN